ncbi:DUF2589 domain-containing protein [Kiloniella laminariae]|uniref:DUF2589 domain-containing protein n=1 Tax=Kiloniella laminariae TaxID=454162 RepID=A0ABT4LK11_9PROT|nr:DUF2589 domain-containing protein [Kiloniella laminariae]MCZ4280696.1 DUF2589 domain-containing protein [Kiloniella laminariae]
MADDKTPAKGSGGSAIGNELGSIPMEHLIAAPLAASIKAQKQLGHEMVSFINMLAYGEEGTPKTKGATPKDILSLPMKLERPVTGDDGQISVHSLTVAPPVLGLVPIPALLIDSVDINFSMEIHTVDTAKSSSSAEVEAKAKAEANGIFYSGSLEVTGKMSAQRENTRSTDKTAKYDVTVRATQQPPTEGMSKLMDLLASTVEPIKLEKSKP